MKASKINERTAMKPVCKQTENGGYAIYRTDSSQKVPVTEEHNSEALAWGSFWGAVNVYADDQSEVNWN